MALIHITPSRLFAKGKNRLFPKVSDLGDFIFDDEQRIEGHCFQDMRFVGLAPGHAAKLDAIPVVGRAS